MRAWRLEVNAVVSVIIIAGTNLVSVWIIVGLYEWIHWTKIAFTIMLETLGQVWTMLDSVRTSRNMSDVFGHTWSTLDHLRLRWITLDCVGSP